MDSNKKKIFVGILVIFICTLAFYFFYWIKTPTYSLNLIREAVQKHDVTSFEKHVDMDTLYTKAFDDALVAYDKIEGTNMLSNPLAAGFIQMLKAPTVSALKNQTIEAVKGENLTENQGESDAANFAKGVKYKSGVIDSIIKDASVISKETNEAVVAITLHNTKIDKDFIMNVKMSKLDDGTWKIKEITNLVNFLIDVDKAEKEKLAALDAPIKEKIYEAIQLTNGRSNIKNVGSYFPSYVFDSGLKVKNISRKTIKNVKAYILIVRKADKKVLHSSPLLESGPIAVGSEYEFSDSFSINEFKDEHEAILNGSRETQQVGLKPMYVEFDDGSSLVRPTQLPEPTK